MARGTIISRTIKSGEKRYYAALWTERPDGTRKQVWRTFHLKRDAEAYLDQQSKLVREGDYIEPSKMMFVHFYKEWWEKYPKLAESPLQDSTLAGYYSYIQTHILPFFGKMVLSQIKASTIERDFKAYLPSTLSRRTVRRILMILRTMLNTAVQWDYLRVNPFHQKEKVSLPKEPKEQKGRALAPQEIRRLLEASIDDGYPIIATAVLTGMRLGELFGLRWDDIDFQKNQISVTQSLYWRRGKMWNGETGFRFKPPKSTASIRRIDMSPRLRKILLEHKLKSVNSHLGLVFCSSVGTPWDRANFIKRLFNPALEAAALGKLRFHDLRHTFGSLKIEQGENIKYVQVQMGHSSISVTLDVYGHLLKQENPHAAARTDELVFGCNQSDGLKKVETC